MLGPVPCTVTVPDSGDGATGPLPPPPPPPQLSAIDSKQARAAASAVRHERWSCGRVRGCLRTNCLLSSTAIVSNRQASAQRTHQSGKGRFGCGLGKVEAVDAAVIVTVAVLLFPSVPTEQVTPASVLDAVQVKLTLLAEKLLTGVKVSVDVALAPGLTVKLLGDALNEKSAVAVEKLEIVDQDALWPEGTSAWTSQKYVVLPARSVAAGV